MLSISLRQSLEKLLLPFYFFFAVALVLIGISVPTKVETCRVRLFGFLTPAYRLAAQPGHAVSRFWGYAGDATHMVSENQQLRLENARLRRWYDVAIALEDENKRLKANLKWLPERNIAFVTGRAIRDASGLYNRSVLIALPEAHEVRAGDLVLGGAGVIGRISEIGKATARVLLISDPISRIPVYLSSSQASAIMSGDGTTSPRLIYFAQDDHPIEGERVVTGGHSDQSGHAQGAALPSGIFIGVVHYNEFQNPVVIPAGSVGHPDVLRVLDFSQVDETGPSAPGRVKTLEKSKTHASPLDSLFPNRDKGQG